VPYIRFEVRTPGNVPENVCNNGAHGVPVLCQFLAEEEPFLCCAAAMECFYQTITKGYRY
jgi:hypothetical protein